jgi:hypothetical protein
MAALVAAIPILLAQRAPKRDGRHKAGHDHCEVVEDLLGGAAPQKRAPPTKSGRRSVPPEETHPNVDANDTARTL